MKELIKKHRKIFVIFSIAILSFILINLFFLVKLNINKIIIVSLKQTLNYNVDFSDFKFTDFNTIQINNFELKSRDNKEIIVTSPKLEINLGLKDIFKGYVIESIVVNGGYSNIQVYDIKKVNIVDATIGHTESGFPDEINIKGLKKIIVKNMITNFSDISYKLPIQRKVKNINGELNFLAGLELFFRGYEGEKNDEFVFFALSVKNKELKINLKVQNYSIDSQVSQYGRSDEFIDIYEGKADFDIELRRGLKLFGSGSIENFKGKVKNTGIEIKNGMAEFLFQKDRIEINSTVDFQDNKIESKIIKIGNKVDLNLKGMNLNIKDLQDSMPKNLIKLPEISGVISYFSIKTLIELGKIKEPVVDLYFRSKKIDINQKNTFSDIKGEVIYKNGIIGLKNLRFQAEINELDDYPINANFVLDGEYKSNLSKLKYKFININSFAYFDQLEGEISYDFEKGEVLVTNNTEKLYGSIFYSNKGELDLNLDIDNYVLKYENKDVYNMFGKLKLKYNLKTFLLKDTLIDIKLKNNYYFEELTLNAKDEKNHLKIEDFFVKANKSYIKFSGKINFQELSYELLLKNTLINTKDIFYLKKIEDLNVITEVSGQLIGDSKKFLFDGEIDSEKGDYYFNYRNFKSKFKLLYDEKNIGNEWKLTSKSSVRYFQYENVFFKDMVLNIGYENNKIIVNKIHNNLLTLTGEYNIINSVFNINYKLNNYNFNRLEVFKDYDLTGEIENLKGKVFGDLDDLKITLDLNNAYVKYKETKKTPLSGYIEYYKNDLKINDLKINKNLVNGTIDLNIQNLDLKINVFEEELYRYYNYPDLKYRLIGEINLWGELNNIKGVSKLNIDKIYFKGEPIPKLSLETTYNSGDINSLISTGMLSLNKLTLFNNKGKEISGINGFLDLRTKDFNITLKKDSLKVSDLSYLITSDKIDGNISLDIAIKGNLEESLNYRTEISSENIEYQNIYIDNFNLLLVGNEEKVDLKYLKLKYGENSLDGFGNFNLNEFTYQFKLKGENIDLSFLNILKNDTVKDIKGFVSLDLDINELDNKGEINISNFSALTSDEKIKFENFNGKINFQEKEFRIKELNGKVNKGDISLKGYYALPKLSRELLNDYSILYNDFEFKIYANNFNYFNDMMNLFIDTELNINSNEIKGDLVVKSGEIYKLPEINDITTEAGAKRDIYFDKINMKVNLTVTDQVVVRIEELSKDFDFINDLELNLEGDGTVTIQNGKINFIGSFSSEKGALNFNNTVLEINNALVIFEKSDEYFPDINPSISINSQTEVSGEEIYVGVSGYYNELQLNLSSKSGLSEQDITSLLLFQKTFDDTQTSQVVKDILEKQLSSQIFNPISNEMERILNISNVSISSKLLTESEGENYRLTNDLILGAVIELSDPIYKDKVFWNTKTEFSETESGKIDNFDLWISYKINKNVSWKTGIKRDTQIESDKLDVHLDLDFKYKIDSFLSMLNFIRKQN